MKAGLNARRKSALARLEAQRKKFVEAHEDRSSYTSTRSNSKGVVRKVVHQARSYEKEVERLNSEIKHLKELIK